MSTLTPEEESLHPRMWHDPDDLCKRMKAYCRIESLLGLAWMHENCDAELTSEAIDTVVTLNGSFSFRNDALPWIHENIRVEFTAAAMDGAAGNNHRNTVEWLHENRSVGCTTAAMDNAARIGCLDIVKWLHQNRSEGCTTVAMDSAAGQGHIDTLKWIQKNYVVGCTPAAMVNAAAKGYPQVIKYLHESLNQQVTIAAIDILLLRKSIYTLWSICKSISRRRSWWKTKNS